MKKLLALVLAVVMVLSLAACGPQNVGDGTTGGSTVDDGIPEEQRYGGHLNLCFYTKITNLDPAKSTGVWNYMWTSMIFETPLTRDGEGNIRPNVCEYELSEDNLTLKLWVREGMTFHDGSPVEIEDVVASMKRAVHKSPREFVAGYIKDVTIENGVATVTFKEYAEKTMYYIACVNPFIGVMPKEIAERFSYESGEVITNLSDCIGTGPYKIADFEDSVKIELVRYDGYKPVEGNYTGFAAPKKAYMDSITVYCNTDAANSTLALLDGELDMFSGVSSDFDAEIEMAGLKELKRLSTTCTTLQFNTFGGSIVNTSADMRKAIAAAIDLDALISFMSDGKVTKAGMCPVMDGIYYTDVFEKADYMGPANIELSKQYQQKAGYNGEEIRLVMSNSYADVATLCNGWLKDAGINCKVELLESASWSELSGDPAGDWTFYWTNPSINNTPTLLATNLTHTNFNSAEKDRLFKELQGMVAGSEEYIAKWHELAQVWVDELPTLFLSQNNLTWTMDPDLNFDYVGTSAYFFNAYWSNPAEHGKK